MVKDNPKIAEYLKNLPKRFYERYIDREGYCGDSRRSQASRKLRTCAEDIWYLIEIFKNVPDVCDLKQFANLKRLFNEQCKS
jgi:hypothetical protein